MSYFCVNYIESSKFPAKVRLPADKKQDTLQETWKHKSFNDMPHQTKSFGVLTPGGEAVILSPNL